MPNYLLFAFQLVAFALMVYLMWSMYRQLRKDAVGREAVDPTQLRGEVSQLIQELRRTADQINADITARTNALQKLVEEAERKGAALEGKKPASPSGRGRAREARAGEGAAPRSSVPRRDALTPTLSQRERGRVAEPTPGAPLGTAVRTVPGVGAGSPAAATAYRQVSSGDGFVALDLEDTGKFQAVRRLASQGLSAAEIARATQLGREEVELIMRVGEGSQ